MCSPRTYPSPLPLRATEIPRGGGGGVKKEANTFPHKYTSAFFTSYCNNIVLIKLLEKKWEKKWENSNRKLINFVIYSIKGVFQGKKQLEVGFNQFSHYLFLFTDLHLFTLLPRKTSSNPKHLYVNFHFDKVLSVHWRSKGPGSWFCDWRNWKYECVTWKTRAISVIFSREKFIT